MGSTVFAVALPVALGIVMFGLGLTLTVGDFARVLKYPKAALVALSCQLIVMPIICFGLVKMFGLDGALAVGMMLLAASPGGSSANLFSHIAGGNVALNVTLTAINSVLAVLTLPVVVGLSYSVFLDDGAGLGLQPAKFMQVFAIVLVPVALGMWVRSRWTEWAVRMQRTVKIGSGVALVLVVCAALFSEFDAFTDHVGELGAIALLLCTIGLGIGYGVPRLFGVRHEDAIASSMEIGIHNAALAIAVAATVLNNDTMAVPAAVYGFLMNIPAGVATVVFARSRTEKASTDPGVESVVADRTA